MKDYRNPRLTNDFAIPLFKFAKVRQCLHKYWLHEETFEPMLSQVLGEKRPGTANRLLNQWFNEETALRVQAQREFVKATHNPASHAQFADIHGMGVSAGFAHKYYDA